MNTEYDLLQLPCQKYLDDLGIRYRVKHNNQSQQKYRAKANKKYNGFPDIEIYFNGVPVFCEFKAGKNKLELDQLDWKDYLQGMGYDYYEIRDLKQFVEIVKIYI